MATSVTSTGITFPDATTQTTAASAAFASGTLMLFQQTSAPTGWTKQTTHNNKALRVVSGTASSGGSVAFTTAFASQAVSGNVSVSASTGAVSAPVSIGNTTLTTPQIPSHSHTETFRTSLADWQGGNTTGSAVSGATDNSSSPDSPAWSSSSTSAPLTPTGNAGGGGSHTHPGSGGSHSHPVSAPASFSGTAINLAVQYVDLIIASKD